MMVNRSVEFQVSSPTLKIDVDCEIEIFRFLPAGADKVRIEAQGPAKSLEKLIGIPVYSVQVVDDYPQP